MHRDGTSQAFQVTSPTGERRAVLAEDWLGALTIALRDAGYVDEVQELVVKRTAAGIVAQVDGEPWAVRNHPAPPPQKDATGIDAADDVATASRRALEAALAAVPAESGAVLLADRGFLRFMAAAGPHSKSLMGVRLPATAGVAGHALRTQRMVVVDEVDQHPGHYAALDAITGYRTRQILAVPVSSGGVVFGVIELMNPPSGQGFSVAGRRAVEGVARVLAAYLDRARRIAGE